MGVPGKFFEGSKGLIPLLRNYSDPFVELSSCDDLGCRIVGRRISGPSLR